MLSKVLLGMKYWSWIPTSIEENYQEARQQQGICYFNETLQDNNLSMQVHVETCPKFIQLCTSVGALHRQ
jgi:hypothetical protein